MPNQKDRKAEKPVSDFTDAPAFTQENFEKELKALSAKAKEETTFKHVREQVSVIGSAALLLGLAAIYSNISQLSLSPVYGGIPSAMFHSQSVMVACFLGWSGNLTIRRSLTRKPIMLLPLISLWTPTVQYYLLQLSQHLGARIGPVVTEAFTFLPLLLFSVSCTATILDDLEIGSFRLPGFITDAAPGLTSYAFYKFVEKYSGIYISSAIGTTFFHTRLGLQILLGAVYTALSPSRLILYALPAILHTAIFNPHVQTPYATASLNATLNNAGWSILDRQDSLTGYISVLESHKDGFRVMRCDHSLLGGEWTMIPRGLLPGQMKVKEPIYAIFAMLEAVRLVEVPNPVLDKDANALVIGLGIGTTPSALMAHGIDTTIVEIDPVVHDYATKYFGLPADHTKVIADAVSYASSLAHDTDKKYDYIVHDVFTGGAEPVDLFTFEFLSDLHTLLKPDGVIAINYAGDLLLPSAHLIVHTILSIFPTCRIFRELEMPSPSQLREQGQDFTNMVIFCTNMSPTPDSGNTKVVVPKITFREPNEADYLESGARRVYLMPKHEIDITTFDELAKESLAKESLKGSRKGEEGDVGDAKQWDILRANDTDRLTKWQQKSAVGHWAVMRTVLPSHIWEAW